MESEIIAGRHFPISKPEYTLAELLDRYVQDIMPRKTPETQRSRRAAVGFWQKQRWQAVVRAVTASHTTDTRSPRAYRFSLSRTRYPSTIHAIVTRNHLFTAHPSLQGESVSS
jgi:hypothetical protein